MDSRLHRKKMKHRMRMGDVLVQKYYADENINPKCEISSKMDEQKSIKACLNTFIHETFCKLKTNLKNYWNVFGKKILNSVLMRDIFMQIFWVRLFHILNVRRQTIHAKICDDDIKFTKWVQMLILILGNSWNQVGKYISKGILGGTWIRVLCSAG